MNIEPSLLYAAVSGLVAFASSYALVKGRTQDNADSVKELGARVQGLEIRVVASETSVASLLSAINDLKASVEKLSDKLDSLRDAA